MSWSRKKFNSKYNLIQKQLNNVRKSVWRQITRKQFEKERMVEDGLTDELGQQIKGKLNTTNVVGKFGEICVIH